MVKLPPGSVYTTLFPPFPSLNVLYPRGQTSPHTTHPLLKGRGRGSEGKREKENEGKREDLKSLEEERGKGKRERRKRYGWKMRGREVRYG